MDEFSLRRDVLRLKFLLIALLLKISAVENSLSTLFHYRTKNVNGKEILTMRSFESLTNDFYLTFQTHNQFTGYINSYRKVAISIRERGESTYENGAFCELLDN